MKNEKKETMNGQDFQKRLLNQLLIVNSGSWRNCCEKMLRSRKWRTVLGSGLWRHNHSQLLKIIYWTASKNKGEKNIAKERRVIPDPIDDRKFQEWKESGKSGILLGITLNPKKCIGEKVRRIPINVETKW